MDTRPRKDYPEKVCSSCGNSYKPRQHNQVICSAECRQDIQHSYKRNWWLKNRSEDVSPRVHYKKDWVKANPGKEYTGREVKLWHSAKTRATLANRIKTDANSEELEVFAKWVLKQ